MEKTIIEEILRQDCFVEKPPVLVDIGASGGLREIWKSIAPFSTYIAFDADTRDFKIEEDSKKAYKKSFVINRIVSDKEGIFDFYLTKNPHCSSTLEPDLNSLRLYHIKSFFEVEKRIKLPAVSLGVMLSQLGIEYIDWFKTDTQGTDLRIFKSMDEKVINKILVAEFEPGILDAYKGEDKLYKIMQFFDENKNFWCDECVIKGMIRMKEEIFNKLNPFMKRFIYCFDKPSAFWAEISYMNSMEDNNWTKRDYYLMVVFALVKQHYGFALEVIQKAKNNFSDSFLDKIESKVVKIMKQKGIKRFPFYILKRIGELFLGELK